MTNTASGERTARRVIGTTAELDALATWCGGRFVDVGEWVPGIRFPGPDGELKANMGDYIICDEAGACAVWRPGSEDTEGNDDA